MNKKVTFILVIFISIFITGCGKEQAKTKPVITTKSNAVVSKNDNNNDNNNNMQENSLERYSGTWVSEDNLKNDFQYGIRVVLTVDKNGNVQGGVGNSSENLTHVSNAIIKGKIQENKLICAFKNDNWDHSGTIELVFNENKIVLTIKYNENSSKDNFWGIGEGTFALISSNTNINRTLDNLKDGGLQVIGNQCFPINLQSYGKVKFISGLKRENCNDEATFYLVDDNENVLYKLPSFYGNSKGRFNDILAISFTDVNKDGLKDIVIIADYTIAGSNKAPIASIYFQNGKELTNNKNFDDKMNNSKNNKDITTVVKYAKENLNK